MSDLYRSAIHARVARLPPLPIDSDEEEGDEEAEAADSIGDLPSTIGGTPIMCVNFPSTRFLPLSMEYLPGHSTLPFTVAPAHPALPSLLFQEPHTSHRLPRSLSQAPNSISGSTIPRPSSQMARS